MCVCLSMSVCVCLCVPLYILDSLSYLKKISHLLEQPPMSLVKTEFKYHL